eukprot:1743443-Amphidinium_carterae.1
MAAQQKQLLMEQLNPQLSNRARGSLGQWTKPSCKMTHSPEPVQTIKGRWTVTGQKWVRSNHACNSAGLCRTTRGTREH